jgi:hypothetical protein
MQQILLIVFIGLWISAPSPARQHVFAAARGTNLDAPIYHSRIGGTGGFLMAIALHHDAQSTHTKLAVADDVAGRAALIELDPCADAALAKLHRELQARGQRWSFGAAVRELGIGQDLPEDAEDVRKFDQLRALLAIGVCGPVAPLPRLRLEVHDVAGAEHAILIRFDAPSALAWCSLTGPGANARPRAVALEALVPDTDVLQRIPSLLARLVDDPPATRVVVGGRGHAIRHADRTCIELLPGTVPVTVRVDLPELQSAPTWFALLDAEGWPAVAGTGRSRIDRGRTNLADRHLTLVHYPRAGAGWRDPLLDLLVEVPAPETSAAPAPE